VVSHVLTSLNGRPLLIDATANVPAAAQLSGQVPVNSTESFSYRIVIPRGQFAAPGSYDDTLTLELYALDSSGQTGSTPVDNTTLRLSYSVPQILSVNIKGAGTQGNRIWNFVAFEHDSDSAEGSIDIIGAEAWTGFGIAFPELWIRVLATRGFMICMNFC
jgi:hypothetical protein